MYGLSRLQVKLASKLLYVARKCILVVWIKDKPPTGDQRYNETFRILPLERLGAVSNGNKAEFENVWSPFFCSLPQNISQVCKKGRVCLNWKY